MSIKVISGADSINSETLNGNTVKGAIERLEDVLDLTGEEDVKLNGVSTTGDAELSDGDTLEFVKAAGSKGADSTVELTHGADRISIEISSGMTVGELLTKAAAILGINGDESVKVNGQPATDDAPLGRGDRVEVSKAAGSKGC